MGLGKVAGEQGPRAQGVDTAWNAAGVLVHQRKHFWLEARVAFPAHLLQPMLDVGARFVAIEGSQVIGGDYALAQLLHGSAAHQLAQLRDSGYELASADVKTAAELELWARRSPGGSGTLNGVTEFDGADGAEAAEPARAVTWKAYWVP